MRQARRDCLWTLGAYLACAFSVLSVLLTMLLTYPIERAADRQMSSAIGGSLAALANQTASRLDRGMFERYREVQLMSRRIAGLKDRSAAQAELDAAKESYPFYAWLGVVDAQGIVRAASGGVLQGADVSQRPWLRKALSGIHLGDVHDAVLLGKLRGSADGEPPRVFDIAFPMQRGGAPAGVLAARVSWDWAKDARETIFGLAGHTAAEPLIVSADGVVLLGPAGTEGRKLTLASLTAARQAATGYITETWPDGTNYLVGFARSNGFLSSPGLGWTVLVREPVDLAHAAVHEIGTEVLAWGVSLAVLFSLLGWLAARAIARPLLSLAGDARRMEQGERVEVQPSRAYREVAMLGSALNSLLGKLRQKSDALQQLNAELEQRVEHRTAELQAAFERVRTNEQRIQTIIESAQDPFIATDLQGRIVDWNTQAEVAFGWGREEVLGRPATMLLPDRFAGKLHVGLEAYARTGTSSVLNRAIERIVVDRYGREIAMEVKIGLVATGNERFFSIFLHDISQRKEVERMKDEFISTVSHELRTPLTAIYGSLDLLTSGAAGELPADAQQLLAISHQSTERLIRLINDMLDLEKIASGKIEYRPQVQPLRPLVEQAIQDTRAYAEGLRVEYAFAGADDAPVAVDADRIVQVCINLLSNAAKFSPAGGRVEVTLQVGDGVARIGVADHGPGLPPAFHDRVFQRFAQADSSARRAKGGTGLGLAICRSIVEAHGGRLAFTSEPDVRTEFFFELPLAGR